MSARNRVLVVDDNLTNLMIVEEALENRYDLLTALNGNTALELAARFRPDVVLLDIMMPAPDGYEVCRRLKTDPLLRHGRVIMVSARTDINDRLRGYEVGADDYLIKPFNEQELHAKVRVALKMKSADEFDAVQRQLENACGFNGEVLALVSQLRDVESGDHLVRVRAICHILAGELRRGPFDNQIDDRFLDDLYYASIMHDVGKIAIPDHILRNPDQLNADEQEQLKQHTVAGERIMNRLAQHHHGIELYRMAAAVARSHHESYDGSGYPDAIRGMAIPLSARIVKVADAFDVAANRCLSSNGHKPQFACDEIIRRKALDFDPVIVDAFQNMIDDIVDLYEDSHFDEVLELSR
jgi:putative two-component system response regulator